MTARPLAVSLVACVALAGGGLASTVLAPNTAATGTTPGGPSSSSPAADDTGVVDVTTRLGYQGAGSAGTGIVVRPGEVLTNNHVIRGATQISVTRPGGGRYRARVLGTDATHDVALLEIGEANDVPPATLGDSSQLAVGDQIRAIGNAGGVGGTPSVAGGRVTGLNQSITTTNEIGLGSEHLSGLIRTDARLEPGYSGGPLLNGAGQVIGMDTAGRVDPPAGQKSAPEGFAIPINRAMAIARDIEAGRDSADVQTGPPPMLGVELLDGAFPIRGVLVAGVVAGSPADAAGLALWDTITSLDGTAVRSTDALTRVLQRHQPRDDVRVRWIDPLGRSHVATVRLAKGPPA
jgi:S1-C subfamily serine protease